MTTQKKELLLGAHISIEGGLYLALERGASINCTVIQIFTKSNRQWHSKALSEKEIEKFKENKKLTKIKHVVNHASYLLNLASPKIDVYEKSVRALKQELERCNLLEIPYLVVHPGAYLDSEKKDGLKKIAMGIDAALDGDKGKTMILLETMAGQGTTMGSTFEELGEILKKIKHTARVGVCLDTCHVFAAGYDFTKKEAYKKMWEDFSKYIGIRKLKVIHVNESKRELGSKVDRHEGIGKGKIGLEGFKLLFNDKRFYSIPKILETPKASLKDDEQNMNKLIDLLSPTTLKVLKIRNG